MAQVVIRNPAALRASPLISRKALMVSGALARRRLAAYFKAWSAQRLRIFNSFLADTVGSYELSPSLRIKSAMVAAAQLFTLIRLFIIAAVSDTAFFTARIFHGAVLWLREAKVRRINGALLMGMVAAIMLAATFIGLGLEVTVNGTSIGYVSSQQEFENAVISAQNRVSEVLGAPYKIDIGVGYRFDFVDRRKILDLGEVENQLFEQVSEVDRLYVLRIDGEIIGAHSSKELIEVMLNSMLEKYPVKDPDDRVEFLRDINISYELTAASNSITPTRLYETLYSNQRDTVTNIAGKDESVEEFAARNGISPVELMNMNPAIEGESIAAGDELIVKKAIPFLSVKYSDRQVYPEVIPYETEIINDDSMFVGEKKTVTQGADGEARITADVIYIDGEQVEHSIVLNETVVEPVAEVIRVGAKQRVATGSFMRPASGKLTSNYGYRGREMHTGVDFAAPKGTKVVAADGGTVTFAGWKGNYGNCVIISHGNGVSTLYAHNSSLTVKVGQKVGKGEMIARMGSTGRSTGSHCHFEVRINNKPVNPWNYIS